MKFLTIMIFCLVFVGCKRGAPNSDDMAKSDAFYLSDRDLLRLKDDAMNGDSEAEKKVYAYYAVYLQDMDLANDWAKAINTANK